MPTTRDKLEWAFSKIRCLSPTQQQAALEALGAIAEELYMQDAELPAPGAVEDAGLQ